MSLTTLVGSLLVAVVLDGPATPTSEDRAAYELAKAAVRRDAGAHVRLALWCERRGLEAERVRHLALAVLIDADHAAARGLLGLVAYGGGWRRPDAVAERERSDGALASTRAAYRARRARAPGTADGHWKLALWCDENGLEDEATAHLTAVTRRDPSREAAWKRLGYKRSEGRWMTADHAAALKADREAQAEADDPDAWMAWWADQQGYVYEGPAGNPRQAGAGGEPPPGPVGQPYVRRPPIEQSRPKPVLTSWVHFSCFAAGTPVHGMDGPLPIERVRVGDRVLTQDTRTGLLSFQPIVAVYHNPPSATLRIDLGGDTVIATGIHRFWSADRGWVMARDLKPGDRVRTVGGVATVRGVKDDLNQLVYNLEVARGGSFFVGRFGALVHDNSLVQPVNEPFDAPAAVAARVPGRMTAESGNPKSR